MGSQPLYTLTFLITVSCASSEEVVEQSADAGEGMGSHAGGGNSGPERVKGSSRPDGGAAGESPGPTSAPGIDDSPTEATDGVPPDGEDPVPIGGAGDSEDSEDGGSDPALDPSDGGDPSDSGEENCYQGYYLFNDEDLADFLSFVSSTPITCITGDFSISGDITSLVGLEHLKNIGGSLEISDADELTDLTGLDNLEFVGGDVVISANSNLLNLQGLGKLESVGGEFIVEKQGSLRSLEGINSLQSIEGSLLVASNEQITTLAGLETLRRVGEEVRIYQNESLETCEGIGGLLTVGSLEIGSFAAGNPSLVSIAQFSNVTSVENINIEYNEVLPDLDGLENIAIVQGELWITGNPLLGKLDGLDALTTIEGGASISGNASLPHSAVCSFLQGVDLAAADYYVADNAGGGTSCAVCQPNESQCVGVDREICDESGYFTYGQTCSSACADGECVENDCDFAQRQCQGEGIDICSSTGEWEHTSCFRDSCVDGDCAFRDCERLAGCCSELAGVDKITCENVSEGGSNEGCASTVEGFQELGACQ